MLLNIIGNVFVLPKEASAERNKLAWSSLEGKEYMIEAYHKGKRKE